jgi:hypothetical protein
VHQVAVLLELIFNGLACWLAIGLPESEAKKVRRGAVEILLGPYDAKQSAAF